MFLTGIHSGSFSVYIDLPLINITIITVRIPSIKVARPRYGVCRIFHNNTALTDRLPFCIKKSFVGLYILYNVLRIFSDWIIRNFSILLTAHIKKNRLALKSGNTVDNESNNLCSHVIVIDFFIFWNIYNTVETLYNKHLTSYLTERKWFLLNYNISTGLNR